jgi:hypothetical protein
MAVLTGKIYDINAELLRYRQHGTQHFGANTRSVREKLRLNPARRYETYSRVADAFEIGINRIGELDAECLTVDKSWAVALFRRKQRFAHNRTVVYDREERLRSKLGSVVDNVRTGRYSMGGGWAGALKDTTAALYL